MRVAIAQTAPVLLDRDATIARVVQAIHHAADEHAALVAFGETLVPGYPVWLSRTGGARWNDPTQKAIHARYLDQAVNLEAGHLAPVQQAAAERNIAVVIGVAERPKDRAGHTIFATAVTIDPTGNIASAHRKLVPTYDERLVWAHGDAHGLVAHTFTTPFTLGSLNCWENWLPLARAALAAQGVDLHVALWPGSAHNTQDITRFIAKESRSFVLSASAPLTADDIPADFLHNAELSKRVRDHMLADDQTPASGVFHNGGSAIAAPDGEWLVPPTPHTTPLITADLDHAKVRRERHNFDHAGHYARPELLQLLVDRRRHPPASFIDEPADR